MKIQFLNGGLANQAFQYIFVRHYELSHPGEIMYMDDSYFALNTVHNGYELEKVFGIKPHMLSECFDEDVWSFILEERKAGKSVPKILCENGIEVCMLSEVGEEYRNFNPFDGKVTSVPCSEYLPQILDLAGDIYYHGYWIHKNWFLRFQDEFLGEFTFPEITDATNLEYKRMIESTNSVSVHIRRGDYVKVGWALDPGYYKKWIADYISGVPGQWHAFVFSDDVAWCKEHEEALGLNQFPQVTYVEGNMQGQNFRDLQLMSMCKGMIVSNSSFCYLATLLNTRKQYWLNCTSREF